MTRIDTIKPGDKLPERSHTPDKVQLFLYNAALWNAHLIHYDYPYATEVEGYPGLVIAGPMLGDWLTQCVIAWLGEDGRIEQLEYSNRVASYIGETLRAGGTVVEVDKDNRTVRIDVSITNEKGQVITPGVITARFHDE